MAEHNYAAGTQMTMATVVRNYLRWFELNRYKRSLPTIPGRHFAPLGAMAGSTESLGSMDFSDSLSFRKSNPQRKSKSGPAKEHSEEDRPQTAPMLESDF